MAFYLSYLLAFYLAYFLAYVLAYFLAFHLAFYVTYYLANLLAFYLANILALYLAYLLAFYLTFYLAFYLAYLLAFYLAYLLTFYLAYLLALCQSVWHILWHFIWPLRSSGAHWAGKVPGWGPAVRTELGRSQVEVQRCALSWDGPRLRSSGAHWAGKVPGWGPAVRTELGRSQVEVQQCALSLEVGEELGEELVRRKWRWKLMQTWSRRNWRRRRRRRTTALIKSNNPHLAGGELIHKSHVTCQKTPDKSAAKSRVICAYYIWEYTMESDWDILGLYGDIMGYCLFFSNGKSDSWELYI